MTVRAGRCAVTGPRAVRVPVLETHRVLQLARAGRLQPWLGPALRGLAGGRLKARTCRHSVALQLQHWTYCRGCPLRSGCAYGETIEGGDPEAADATRPVVIAPTYPCPERGRAGDRIRVRITFIGEEAAAHAEQVWEALRIGGADPGLGLGPDRVLFDVLPGDQPDRPVRLELTDPGAETAQVEKVRVVFTSPLVLKTRETGGRRRLITRPSLADLLRGWESLAGLLAAIGSPVPAEWLAEVVRLAARVPTISTELTVVRQFKSSHRTHEQWDEEGITGWAEYGPLPRGLMRWLEAAGRLHVGTHRVAGAGGWQVTPPRR